MEDAARHKKGRVDLLEDEAALIASCLRGHDHPDTLF